MNGLVINRQASCTLSRPAVQDGNPMAAVEPELLTTGSHHVDRERPDRCRP